MSGPPLEVKVWADMACYTRPETKVERVSYPVPTPSAARGVLEAIFWKPEFSWRVREIVVLNPIRYVSLLRNEVEVKASPASGRLSITEVRQQRHTLALHTVCYIIRADIETRSHATTTVDGYRDQFRRRVNQGQCFHRPYLGCREFACEFAPPDGTETPLDESRDLGLMLFDIVFRRDKTSKSLTFFHHGGRDEKNAEKRERDEVSGYAVPLFFAAKLENGVLRVPPELYQKDMG